MDRTAPTTFSASVLTAKKAHLGYRWADHIELGAYLVVAGIAGLDPAHADEQVDERRLDRDVIVEDRRVLSRSFEFLLQAREGRWS